MDPPDVASPPDIVLDNEGMEASEAHILDLANQIVKNLSGNKLTDVADGDQSSYKATDNDIDLKESKYQCCQLVKSCAGCICIIILVFSLLGYIIANDSRSRGV